MKKLIYIMVVACAVTQFSFAQHPYDDSFTAQPADSYTIDGVGDEAFWEECAWYNMEYVWIPYGASMTAGDFTGRVKFAWTEEKLLILAEIEDDVLSDTHEQPDDNYWNDDCFEVFLDEDYSGGWHQNSYNAFAYHCAINEEDVIDSGDDNASNVNLKDHVEFDLDTIDATNYVWELAFTIYDDSFNESNASNTTVTLTEDKEMGISVAYCDNDGGSQRENFIGLVNVAEEHYNSSWQDASVFGKLTLAGTGTGPDAVNVASSDENINLYLDYSQNLVIENLSGQAGKASVAIYDLNGRLMHESKVYLNDMGLINVSDLNKGSYIVTLRGNNFNKTELIYKN